MTAKMAKRCGTETAVEFDDRPLTPEEEAECALPNPNPYFTPPWNRAKEIEKQVNDTVGFRLIKFTGNYQVGKTDFHSSLAVFEGERLFCDLRRDPRERVRKHLKSLAATLTAAAKSLR